MAFLDKKKKEQTTQQNQGSGNTASSSSKPQKSAGGFSRFVLERSRQEREQDIQRYGEQAQARRAAINGAIRYAQENRGMDINPVLVQRQNIPVTNAIPVNGARRTQTAPTLMELAEAAVANQKKQDSQQRHLDRFKKYGYGNIDLTNRPQYVQPDGKISTVNSMSFGNDEGEILVPTIDFDEQGKPRQLTDDEAIDRYYRTGEHLGKFKTVEEANDYADYLHRQQDYYYNQRPEYLKKKQVSQQSNAAITNGPEFGTTRQHDKYTEYNLSDSYYRARYLANKQDWTPEEEAEVREIYDTINGDDKYNMITNITPGGERLAGLVSDDPSWKNVYDTIDARLHPLRESAGYGLASGTGAKSIADVIGGKSSEYEQRVAPIAAQHPIATGAGSIAGNLILMQLAGQAVGAGADALLGNGANTVAGLGRYGVVRGDAMSARALRNALTFSATSAIHNAGKLAKGQESVGEYGRDVLTGGIAGAVGTIASGLVSTGIGKYLKDNGMMTPFKNWLNMTASGSAFGAADIATRQGLAYATGDEESKMSSDEIATQLTTVFLYSMINSTLENARMTQQAKAALRSELADLYNEYDGFQPRRYNSEEEFMNDYQRLKNRTELFKNRLNSEYFPGQQETVNEMNRLADALSARLDASVAGYNASHGTSGPAIDAANTIVPVSGTDFSGDMTPESLTNELMEGMNPQAEVPMLPEESVAVVDSGEPQPIFELPEINEGFSTEGFEPIDTDEQLMQLAEESVQRQQNVKDEQYQQIVDAARAGETDPEGLRLATDNATMLSEAEKTDAVYAGLQEANRDKMADLRKEIADGRGEEGDIIQRSESGRPVGIGTGERAPEVSRGAGVSETAPGDLAGTVADHQFKNLRLDGPEAAETILSTAKPGQVIYRIKEGATPSIQKAEAQLKAYGVTNIVPFASEKPIEVKTGEHARAYVQEATRTVGLRVNDESVESYRLARHELVELGIMDGKIDTKEASDFISDEFAKGNEKDLELFDLIVQLYSNPAKLYDPSVSAEEKAELRAHGLKELLCDAGGGINQFEGFEGYEDMYEAVQDIISIAQPYFNDKLGGVFDAGGDIEELQYSSRIEETHFDDSDFSEESIQRGKDLIRDGGSIVRITDTFNADESGKHTDSIKEYFDSIGRYANNPVIGKVYLANSGIKHTISKGVYNNKISAFKAVKNVIENGQIVNAEKEWKGRHYDTVVIAGKVTLGDQECLMGVAVKRQPARKGYSSQSYDLHEVIIIGDDLQNGLSSESLRSVGSSPLLKILNDVAEYVNLKGSNEQQNKALKDVGIVVDREAGVAHYEYSTKVSWKTPEQIDKAVKALQKSLGVSKKEAEKYVRSEISLTNLILSPGNVAAMDYEGDDRYTAIKKNSDYPQGTVDFNNNCRKRVPFTTLYERLQRSNPNRVFTAEDLEIIRQEMIEQGYPVACAFCYVEERRQRLGEIAEGFVTAYKNNTLLKDFEGKKEYNKIKAALESAKDDDYVPTIADILTYNGLRTLDAEHEGIAEAFRIYNNARGMQSGRLVEGRAEYKRELLSYTPKMVQRINDLGGLRIFSYSDFEAINLLDLVQIIQDASVVGLKIQAYTKVPAFAKVIRNTGIKLSRSLIPAGTGIKYVDGKPVLDLDTVEGIDVNDPDFFDSIDDRDVGNIIIGMSDEQIRLAMIDSMIDYIIPFHTNLSKEMLVKKRIDHWKNYKLFQVDKDKATGRNATNINIYTDVLEAARAEGHPIKNRKQFQEKFFAVAKERNLIPRFAQFINKNKKGEYIYTPGYEKFLLDFKMFDKNGRIVEQQPVRPVFDDEYNTKLMNDFAKGVGYTEISDDLYSNVVNALNNKSQGAEIQYSSKLNLSPGKYNENIEKSGMNVSYSLSEDGKRIAISPESYMNDATWKKVHNAINKLGYGMPTVDSTKKYVLGGYGLQPDQTKAVKKILGISNEIEAPYIDPSEAKKIAQKAEKRFGTTTSFNKAAYITVNGKLLDFSEGQGYRVQDHREISDVLDLPEDAGYSDGLIEFMNQGNIRLQTYGADIATEPNAAQRSVLTRFINSLDGEFVLDLSNDKGDNIASVEYPEGTRAAKILADIDRYFKDDVIPDTNSVSNFHMAYSSKLKPTDEMLQKAAASLHQLRASKTIDEVRQRNERLAALDQEFDDALTNVKGSTITRHQTYQIASKYIRGLSEANKTEIRQDIQELYELLGNTTKTNARQLTEVAASIADKIFEKSVKYERSPEAKKVSDELKKTKFYISPKLKKEIERVYDSYSEFRRQYSKYMGMTLNKDNANATVESWYAEKSGMQNDDDLRGVDRAWFPRDIIDEADQLLQIADVAKQTAIGEVIEEDYGDDYEEAVYTMAQEILADYFKANGNDKYMQKINLVKQEMREEYEARLDYIASKYSDQLNRHNEKLAKEQAKFIEYKEEQRNKRFTRQMKDQLWSRIRTLKKMKGTEQFEAEKAEIFSQISAVRRGALSKRTIMQLQQAKSETSKTNPLSPEFNLKHHLAALSAVEELDKLHVGEMNDEQLATYLRAVTELITFQRNQNRLMDESKGRYVSQKGRSLIRQQHDVKGIDYRKFVNKWVNTYLVNSLAPTRALPAFDGYVPDGILSEYAQKFFDGEMKTEKFRMEAEKSFSEWWDDKKYMRSLTNDKVTLTNSAGRKAQVTKDMLISLYLAGKDEGNVMHSEAGGWVIPDIGIYNKGDRRNAYTEKNSSDFVMKLGDYQQIESLLSDKDKAYADAIHRYFQKAGSAENEVTNKLYGYSIAGNKHYFPIVVESDLIMSDIDVYNDPTLENSGFTKARTKSTLPIYLDGATKVLQRSINNVSRYYGMTIPLRDFNSVFNFTAYDDPYSESRKLVSGKKSFFGTWGSTGQSYMENLISDLNRGSRERQHDLYDFAIAGYGSAVLGANIRVMASQASSYPMALTVLHPDSLVKGLSTRNAKVDMDYIDSITPSMYMRRKGMSGTEMGEIYSARQRFKETKVGGAIDAVGNGFERIPLLGKLRNGIQRVDVWTTTHLVSACQAEIETYYPELKPGTKAYDNKLKELIELVNSRTQPSYSTMNRNELSKRSGLGYRGLTMFKTQTFNMYGELADAIGRDFAYRKLLKEGKISQREKDRSFAAVGAALAAVFLSQLMFEGLKKSINLALYHDPGDMRDEKTGEVALANMIQSLVSDTLKDITSMPPGGSFITDLGLPIAKSFTGRKGQLYALSVPGKDTVDDLFDQLNKLGQSFATWRSEPSEDNAKKMGQNWAKLVIKVSYFGFPLQNLYNDVNGIYMNVKYGFGKYDQGEGLWGLKDNSPSKEQYANLAVETAKKGDYVRTAYALENTSQDQMSKALGIKVSKKLFDRFLSNPENLAAYINSAENGTKLSDVPDIGYPSYSKLREALGDPERTQNWHHIVEQEQGPGDKRLGTFKAEQINNVNNIVSIPSGTKSPHNAISDYYGSVQDFTDGKTVREWLKDKSFEEQWEFGVEQLKKYGDIVPTDKGWVYVPDEEKIEQMMPLSEGTGEGPVDPAKYGNVSLGLATEFQSKKTEASEDGGFTQQEAIDIIIGMMNDGMAMNDAEALFSSQLSGKPKERFDTFAKDYDDIEAFFAVYNANKEGKQDGAALYLKQSKIPLREQKDIWAAMGWSESSYEKKVRR